MKNKNITTKKFTEKQLAILKIWSEENSIHRVADHFNLSHYTIETQLKRMRKKIGVNRTVDVFIYAQKRNWISL